MGRTSWTAGLGLCAAILNCNSATAETIERLTLEVLIVDDVGVSAETLRQARLEAGRIFEQLGIGIVWMDNEMPQGRYLVIKIISKPVSQKSKNPDVLGVAAGSAEGIPTLAWLFYDRIEKLHHKVRLDITTLLGHVMAHEMGHLLLPYGSHTATGLMKGDWDRGQASLAAIGALKFAPNQTALIRGRLLETNGMMASR